MSNTAEAIAAYSAAAKILLVEDSLPNRDMLTRRLERRGFTVCCAVDGPSGVAMAASEMPDVILMDVALGAMDGWEATRRIKADPRTAKIPIIARPLMLWRPIATRALRSVAPISTPSRSTLLVCSTRFTHP
jgi:PleD family two-component response regulator